MSDNRRTVERYFEGYQQPGNAQILDCLTDDVEWHIPGVFHSTGKEAFEANIHHDAVATRPIMKVTRLIEQDNIIIAEGTLSQLYADGSPLKAVFRNIFEMQDGKIRRLTSYLTPV